VDEMVTRLNQPEACSPAQEKQATGPQPEVIRRASPGKVCQGALGFRARQTRKQEYSVVKEQSAGGPSQVQPRSKRQTKSATDIPKNFGAGHAVLACRPRLALL
jgi:hypothetical protein